MTSDWLILSAIFKPIEQLCWHFELATCRHHVRTSFIEKHGYFFCFGLKKVKLLSSRGILFRQIRKSYSYLKCFRLRKSCFWNSSRIHVTNVTVESFAKTNTGEWLDVFGGVTWEVSLVIVKQELSLVHETNISQICRPYGAATITLTNKADFSF